MRQHRKLLGVGRARNQFPELSACVKAARGEAENIGDNMRWYTGTYCPEVLQLCSAARRPSKSDNILIALIPEADTVYSSKPSQRVNPCTGSRGMFN